MDMAELAATRGTCPRRRVGAVLAREERVVATGYNGSLRGQPHCADAGCLMVGGHCKRTVHAELNALLQCALHGVRAAGATLYTTCFPCLDCAKALVQAGIPRLVYRDSYADAEISAEETLAVLRAAGVAVQRLEPLGRAEP
jgi:dCMP deaminase